MKTYSAMFFRGIYLLVGVLAMVTSCQSQHPLSNASHVANPLEGVPHKANDRNQRVERILKSSGQKSTTAAEVYEAFLLAQELWAAKEEETAVSLFEICDKWEPSLPTAKFLVKFYLRKKDFQKAILYARKASLLFPKDREASLLLAETLKQSPEFF